MLQHSTTTTSILTFIPSSNPLQSWLRLLVERRETREDLGTVRAAGTKVRRLTRRYGFPARNRRSKHGSTSIAEIQAAVQLNSTKQPSCASGDESVKSYRNDCSGAYGELFPSNKRREDFNTRSCSASTAIGRISDARGSLITGPGHASLPRCCSPQLICSACRESRCRMKLNTALGV
jgi:hypothetical protein